MSLHAPTIYAHAVRILHYSTPQRQLQYNANNSTAICSTVVGIYICTYLNCLLTSICANPWQTFQSIGLILAACTCTNTSLGPGLGTFMVTFFSTLEGSPYATCTMALIRFMMTMDFLLLVVVLVLVLVGGLSFLSTLSSLMSRPALATRRSCATLSGCALGVV